MYSDIAKISELRQQ